MMALRLKVYFRNGQKQETIVEFPIPQLHNIILYYIIRMCYLYGDIK